MTKKIALVTGGLGGIGSAICRIFLAQGYCVVAASLDSQVEVSQKDPPLKADYLTDITLMNVDVRSFSSCKDLAAKIDRDIGDVDILVNNAGITADSSFLKMGESQWSCVLHTNLDSMFNVTKQFVPLMIKKGFGRIINIASVNGQKGQFGQTNYSASKAGVHGFTMALAQELMQKGITVNTVLKKIIAQIPAGRLGQPDEIAAAVAFLASPSSSFITGANIPVNGGQFIH